MRKSIQWGNKTVNVGDEGTFFGEEDGPGSPATQATGKVVEVFETRNFGWMLIRLGDGTGKLLKR